MAKSQQALRTGHITCLGALGNSFRDLSGVGSFGGERVALSCPTKALSILRTPWVPPCFSHRDTISLAILNYKALPKKERLSL